MEKEKFLNSNFNPLIPKTLKNKGSKKLFFQRFFFANSKITTTFATEIKNQWRGSSVG